MSIFSIIPDSDLRTALRRLVWEGMVSRALEALSTGVFIIGLAISLGASNFLIGLISALPFLGNIFQLPAIFLVERIRDRRFLVFFCSLFARSFLLLVAIAPFFDNRYVSLWLLLLGVSLRYSIGAISSCAWNSWARDLVPEKIMGKFFGRRLIWLNLSAIFTSLLVARFIDWWDHSNFTLVAASSVSSYSLVFGSSIVLTFLSASLIRTIPHPVMDAPDIGLHKAFLRGTYLALPFRNENFRRLIFFLMAWNFTLNLSVPFCNVYMLKHLGYDMTFVVSATIVNQVANLISLRAWAHHADRYSSKTVLKLAMPLFVLGIFGWAITPFVTISYLQMILVVLLNVLMGSANAGMALANNNISLRLAPRRYATGFLAMLSLTNSFAAGISPLIGGVLIDYFERSHSLYAFPVWHFWIPYWSAFFLLSGLLGFCALYCLRAIAEKGDVPSRLVLSDLMIDMNVFLKSVSTLSGIRDFAMAPLVRTVNRWHRNSKKTSKRG